MLNEILNLIEIGNLTQAVGLADTINIAVDRAEAFKAIALAAIGIKRVTSEKPKEENLDFFGHPAIVEVATSEDILFDQFWSAWPKKLGSKKKAMQSFKRILKKEPKKHEFVQMLCNDIKARFEAAQLGFDRMHATSYLNGERWNDEIDLSQNLVIKEYGYKSNDQNMSTRDMTLADELDTGWAL